jgi:predicted acyltransferase
VRFGGFLVDKPVIQFIIPPVQGVKNKMKQTTTRSTTVPESQRLMSLDALRGFDMFWILGADSIAYALHDMSPNAVTHFFATQLDHAEWQGFRFYDLIFPMFVFMMGVSTVFSLTKIIATEGRAAAVKRVLRRGILLFVIGLIYSGGFTNPWPDMRLLGVLNRIALCYTFGGLLFIAFRTRALIGIAAGILLGYWAMMAWIPIRDIQLEKSHLIALAENSGDAKAAEDLRGISSESPNNPSSKINSPAWVDTENLYLATTNYVTGKYEKGYNVACHFDFEHLPARKYDIFWDPEGLLSTIPAVVTALLGIFAGLLLRNKSVPDLKKVALLIGAGAASAALGWLWNVEFPVIKKIWTSSYVLVAGGYSAMFLGAFYWIVDIKQWRTWCQPFVWIGMNPITLYLTSNFLGGLGFEKLAVRLGGGPVKSFFDTHIAHGCGQLVISAIGVLLFVLFANFLYRKKIFLRF